MKAKPASVHFRANVGFSLSFALLSALVPLLDILPATYEAVTRMYALATLPFSHLNYLISIKISSWIA
jgi:hypothetical protein